MTHQPENKFDNATAYERYVGRWSREIAKEFVKWLDVPPDHTWLDIGAGTGILSDVILRQARPTKVIGVDTSSAYIELAQEQIKDPRAQFYVGDANNLDLSGVTFDAVVAGLVINFVPSPQQAISNMAQSVKVGGLVAAYVWDYSDKMEMMRHFWDAAIKIDSSAIELDSGKRFTICHPDNLKSLFEGEGLKAVDVIALDIQAVFKNFEDYWQPFVAAQGSVSKYLRSLNQESQNAIRDQLQKQLPIEEDGTIHLITRAWAIKGLTP
jgi:ubiquinone/menaquinone biosynthesis C-methylase UbiE